jgi:hypothetical protein
MKTLNTTIALSLAAVVLAFLPACQSPGMAQSGAEPTSAVMCDKCRTVWVKRAVSVGSPGKPGSYMALRDQKAMQCPDCENAIVTFFKTGQLKHHCSHCGGTMTHCVAH